VATSTPRVVRAQSPQPRLTIYPDVTTLWLRIVGYGLFILLGIVLTDAESVTARTSDISRTLSRGNARLESAPVNIPQRVLPMTVSQLAREIRTYRPPSD